MKHSFCILHTSHQKWLLGMACLMFLGNGSSLLPAQAISADDASEVTDTTGVWDYDLLSGGAFGSGISFNVLKYLGGEDSISGAFQANEIRHAGSGKLTFSGNLTIGADAELRLFTTSGDLQFDGQISNHSSGASKLTVTGPGTTYLTATNSYTGMTVVDGGILDVGTISNNSLGSGGLVLLNGAVLQGNGTLVRHTSGNNTPGTEQYGVQSGGFAARGGNLTLDLTSALNDTFDLNISGWRFGTNFIFGSTMADSNVILLNRVNLNTNGQRVFTVIKGVGADDHAELRGELLNSGNGADVSGFIKRGDGVLYLSNANNSYLGVTTIEAGMIRINSIGDGGANSSLGRSSNAATNLVFNGGGLQYIGDSATTDRSFTIQNNRVAVIDVTNAATNLTFTGIINNVTTSGGLTKTGSGTLTIHGAKNYTGRTTVNAGIFDVGDVATLGNSALYFTAAGNGSAIIQGHGTLNRVFDNTNNPEGNLTAGEIAGKAGGFAAKGGKLTLSLGTNIVLNSANHVFGDNFILGSVYADDVVELTSNINLNSNGGSRKITVNQGLGGDYAIISGRIFGHENQTSGLIKEGQGILVLTGANTYNGPTSINQGTVLANYTGPDMVTSPTNGTVTVQASSTGSGNVTVGSNATLGGYGKVGTGSTLVTINGKLSPGDSTQSNSRGTLTIQGNLTLGSAALTALEVSTLDEFDKVVVTSHAILDGTIQVDFGGFSASLFANSFSLDLFDWNTVDFSSFSVVDGTSGDLKFLNVDYGGNAGSWDLSQFTANGAGGGVITWVAVAVPEPSRMCLLILGAFWIFGRRSRNQRR